MEHSTAIMEDAGKAIDGAVSTSGGPTHANAVDESNEIKSGNARTNNDNPRKRRGNFHEGGRHQGSRRGGRSGDSRDDRRRQKGDMGRGEYFASNPDKRQRTNASREQRESGKGPQYGTTFSQAEIDAEERRPKRKVAVLIGYSGTGYKGMQISASEKTIEGDLFNAFVAAGAISKANADDPKKASLVRCARTDKGVHAAGNMISLKLIVEDEDIVQKINQALSPQIRVWGIERTIGSFSCYQACDSRWYEYLIPSYAFLPPHPSSWLAKKLEELADEAGDRLGYDRRQAEVKGFWHNVDETTIKQVLENIDVDIRYDVIKALQGEDEASAKAAKADADMEQTVKVGKTLKDERGDDEAADGKLDEKTEEAAIIINDPALRKLNTKTEEDGTTNVATDAVDVSATIPSGPDVKAKNEQDSDVFTNASNTLIPPVDDLKGKEEPTSDVLINPAHLQLAPEDADRQVRLRAATKRLRHAYNTAKRQYRIPTERVARIQSALSKFVGTANYHNYTIQKTFRDPSAKRHIKSFVVNTKPILIGEGDDIEKTEWLSLKVHGQSFMMHQIRKMVGMVALLVRSGADLLTLEESLGSDRFSIPKVPGLGLLLERPVFDSYNNMQALKHGREKLEFGKHEKELEEFKQREIYQRIFREEEEKNEFVKFFNHVDNFKEPWFLYVTSRGLEATKLR